MSVRFANPDRANALAPDMLDQLAGILRAPSGRVRVVLLGGAGDRHFSGGLDLGERTADELVEFLPAQEERLRRAADAVAQCPVPVIGVVNGAAFGGALELAISCDWRIAARRARFGMPAARLGVVYAPEGLARFVAAIGPARTKQLFLTGDPVDAARAVEIGLVEQVVADAEIWQFAESAAAAVVSAAPLAVEGTRAAIDALAHGEVPADVQQAAARARGKAFASDDFREALAAAREKRAAEFHDR